MFADSHAHLAMPAFEPDRADVLARARAAGVDRIMTCATSLQDAEANLRAARDGGLAAAVGVHPHQASSWDTETESALRRMIDASPEIAAVGEVGLDYHYNYSPPDVQRDVLRRQIGLARAARLPLIVHCRNAAVDLGRILSEERAREVGGVLHCFSEDAAFARECLDQEFYISFSGIVTFRHAGALLDAVRAVPLDRLLVETDAPYLSPVPHRGRRNEPAHVVEVARCVASLKGEPLDRIAAATSSCFDRLFAAPRAR